MNLFVNPLKFKTMKIFVNPLKYKTMKIFKLVFVLSFFILSQNAFAQYSTSFEVSNCSDLSFAFFDGCESNWINVSGSSDLQSNFANVPAPPDGSMYAHMYANWKGFPCWDEPEKVESIALNYDFYANYNYTLTYYVAYSDGVQSFVHDLEAKWILTSGRQNFQEVQQPCTSAIPPIMASDQVVETIPFSGNEYTWEQRTISFIPNQNYDQLFFRPEMKLVPGAANSSQGIGQVYLDMIDIKKGEIEIEECFDDPDFFIISGGNCNSGKAWAGAWAPTAPGVQHWWQIFEETNNGGLAPIGAYPPECCSINGVAFTNPSLNTNQWYSIAHVIWSDCMGYPVLFKKFKVTCLPKAFERQGVEYQDVEAEEFIEIMNLNPDIHAEIIEKIEVLRKSNPSTNKAFESIIDFKSYPNPFTDHVTFEFLLEEKSPVTVYLTDKNSKLIKSMIKSEVMEAGYQNHNFNLGSLPSGTYFLTIVSNKGIVTEKIVKI